MRANDFYNNIHSLQYECDCTSISIGKWDKLMNKAVRADVDKVHRIIRKLLPDFAQNAGLFDKSLKDLRWYMPYNHYRTKTHLVFVHSSIEHFLKIN